VASEGGATAGSGEESVVLATFANRRAAEHLVASLGREFRKKARKGDVAAFVVSGNPDGSLKITRSRVLSGGDVIDAGIRVSVARTAGLMGLFSTLKGGQRMGGAVRVRDSRVGADEQRAHELLTQAGPKAAIALLCCQDRQTRETVAQRAVGRAIRSWDGSRAEFIAALDPGPEHDWVRDALGDSTSTNR
jgi:hypothetical protein